MSASMVKRTVFSLAKISDHFSYFCVISKKCNLPKNVSHTSTVLTSGKRSRSAFSNCSIQVTQRTQISHHRQLYSVLPDVAYQSKPFHTSCLHRGLEEFFDDPQNYGELDVKSGRHWQVDELRLKDNAMLHKLWYVLLKEKNMLLTMEVEALNQDRYMPSPERLKKVYKSMNNIQNVIRERNEALTELKTGHKEEHPGKMVYTPFGYLRYMKPKEHYHPMYINKYYQRKRFRYQPYVRKYMGLWMEQEQLKMEKEKRRQNNQIRKLKRKFPNADVWQN